MSTQRLLGLVIVVLGVALLFFGIFSTCQSDRSFIDKFTGRYNYCMMWYAIGGFVLIAVGIGFWIIRRGRR
ncbi:MAG TPA: DUF3185 family protein [Rhabdochlamydiaceae bacterium]|nr:DUF3185 family protein [Rhabdochlamydiaceae bacterium]